MFSVPYIFTRMVSGPESLGMCAMLEAMYETEAAVEAFALPDLTLGQRNRKMLRRKRNSAYTVGYSAAVPDFLPRTR